MVNSTVINMNKLEKYYLFLKIELILFTCFINSLLGLFTGERRDISTGEILINATFLSLLLGLI
jgi:hypothetical protein